MAVVPTGPDGSTGTAWGCSFAASTPHSYWPRRRDDDGWMKKRWHAGRVGVCSSVSCSSGSDRSIDRIPSSRDRRIGRPRRRGTLVPRVTVNNVACVWVEANDRVVCVYGTAWTTARYQWECPVVRGRCVNA